MRSPILTAAVLVAVLATAAAANMGGSPPPEPSTPQGDIRPTEAMTPRQQAQQLYGGAYDDIAKAGKDLADGKEKNAQKKFKRALDRSQQAVALDPSYYEAWNLVGYASRKLSDYPRSLEAYDRCLKLKPDYTAAREYLGEAYVELGKIREAREQLAWLQRLAADEQASTLSSRIDAWQKAHPDSVSTPVVAPAPSGSADTLRTPNSGK